MRDVISGGFASRGMKAGAPWSGSGFVVSDMFGEFVFLE